MDILIALIVFIVGAGAGFFATQYFSTNSSQQQKMAKEAKIKEDAFSQYKQDVAEHLENSAQLLEQMNNTCTTAMAQMERSTQLLQQATPSDSEHLPYFSKETHEQLAETFDLRHQEKAKEAVRTSAPRDYSGDASGLLSQEKQTVTNS